MDAFAHRQIAEAELDPGERLLWSASPQPGRLAIKTLPIFLFAIPWTAFSVFWVVGAYTMGGGGKSQGVFDFFPLFGVPFILIGLGMLSAPFWAYISAGKTVYGITPNRIFVISGFFSKKVQNYRRAEIGQITRIERSDGSGDLNFATELRSSKSSGRHRTTEHPVGFVGIPEVRNVERLVTQLFKSDAVEEVETP